MTKRTIYFHEDDFCQIELLPAQNRDYCAIQLRLISDFSEKHRAEGGVGWTDCYVRGEAPVPLASLSLSMETVAEALAAALRPFDSVETGYASHREACVRTRAFGFDPDCAVFVSTDASDTVAHMWLGLGGPEESRSKNLLDALDRLYRITPLVMVDWGWGRLFELADTAHIRRYVQERKARWEQLDAGTQATPAREKPLWWKFWGR